MNTHTNNLLPFQSETTSFIRKMLPVSLSNVPFHNNIESITRYFANGFPVHLAVHEVSPVAKVPAAYTQQHLHDDCDEINIILSPEKLLYKIQLGNEEHVISNNSCIWIPRGVIHSANVLWGSGYFITMRIT